MSDAAAAGRAGRRILFAHKNFPAQFGAFGEWLAGQGWEVVFLTQRAGARHGTIRVVTAADHRPAAETTHRYVRGFEAAVITGQGWSPGRLTAVPLTRFPARLLPARSW